MKRFLLTACAGLLAAAVASPSFAADLPRPAYKAPIYVAPFSWSGFYIGINGGYGWGTATITDPAFNISTPVSGWLAGGTVGYNLQTGAWVWGLEGDIAYSTIKGTDLTFCTAPGCESSNAWLATGRGRIGYAWDRWLPFITGGAAYGNVKFSNSAGDSESKSQLGWTIGGGVEYAFMGAWSAKVEYLYVDLGEITCAPTTCGSDTTIKVPLNIVRLGVNYRF